jgi:hypothetical protein
MRAGLLAGTLASICAALAFNTLNGLVGAVSVFVALPAVQEAQARVIADQRRFAPLIVGALAFVVIGAGWGILYGRWGEPFLRRAISADALRGLAFAVMPWAVAAVTVVAVADVDTLGALMIAVVQAAQQATFGVVLGLAYPLLRLRPLVVEPLAA